VSLEEQIPSPAEQQAHQAAPPPQRGTSGLAIAGLILAFLVAPLGFLLSLIAVFKTGTGRDKGRGLAIAGLVVSALIVAGGTTLAVVVAGSTAVDPGCVAGKEAILRSTNTVDVDAASRPIREDVRLKTAIDELKAAAAKARHDNVRAAISALADDYSQMSKAMKSGELPWGLSDKIAADARTFDSLCTIDS
jgi:hypothetical protein